VPYLVKLVSTIRIINLASSKKSRVTKVGEEVKSILRVFIVSYNLGEVFNLDLIIDIYTNKGISLRNITG